MYPTNCFRISILELVLLGVLELSVVPRDQNIPSGTTSAPRLRLRSCKLGLTWTKLVHRYHITTSIFLGAWKAFICHFFIMSTTHTTCFNHEPMLLSGQWSSVTVCWYTLAVMQAGWEWVWMTTTLYVYAWLQKKSHDQKQDKYCHALDSSVNEMFRVLGCFRTSLYAYILIYMLGFAFKNTLLD